jgi:hypothetical protein
MKTKWLAAMVAVLVSAASQGAVFEIKKMHEAVNGVSKETLVVFDIDNTILQNAQTLGSVQWADWYEGTLRKQGLPGDEANLISSREWVRINRVSRQEPVEAVTPNIIANLQARGVKVLALTARPAVIALQTQRDLPRFGVHFSRSWGTDTRFKSPFEGAAYGAGILFVGQTNSKGAVLREFLRQNKVKPSSVRFIDDKRKYVESVEQAMEAAGIRYAGYRYGGADHRVNSFDARLAAFAHDHFRRYGIILSDAAARQKMNAARAILP